MGLGKKLREWSAASDAFERERDAELPDHGAPWPAGSATELVATVLKVAAVALGLVGAVCGVAVGRSVTGWTRPFGLAAPGWIVVFGALFSGLVLYGLGAALLCLDQIRRNTTR